MPTPALATDSLIEDLNNLRECGRLLTNDLHIAKLRKRIEAYKHNNVVEYWLYLASLYSLTGDVEQAVKAGQSALRLTSDFRYHLHHVRTLMHLGRYQLARELIAIPPDQYFLEPDDNECYVLFQVIDFCRFSRLAQQHPMIETMRPMIYLSDATHKILERQKVQEQELLKMVDLAGDLLRDRGLISSYDLQIFPYPKDGTITINLPVSTTPSDVADLDWEYAERLFTLMPDAPATVVHVGFSSAPGIAHG